MRYIHIDMLECQQGIYDHTDNSVYADEHVTISLQGPTDGVPAMYMVFPKAGSDPRHVNDVLLEWNHLFLHLGRRPVRLPYMLVCTSNE